MDLIFNTSVVLITAALMEPFAWLMHRYVMHGAGWAWHRSHHQVEPLKFGMFEVNDLYAVVFAAIAIVLIMLGNYQYSPLQWVGAGMTLYGMIYFLVHDGLVHQRWRYRWIPRSGYLKRLYQAHRLHHAVVDKDHAVSYGFLWAPSPAKLKSQLRQEAKSRQIAHSERQSN
jgi:beta-carotene 3-hydroxylase